MAELSLLIPVEQATLVEDALLLRGEHFDAALREQPNAPQDVRDAWVANRDFLWDLRKDLQRKRRQA